MLTSASLRFFLAIMNLYLGIDPGPVNLGIACLNEEGAYVSSEFFCPRSHQPKEAIDKLVSYQDTSKIVSVGIERFVPYNGVMTGIGEDILMLIGGLVYAFSQKGIPVTLARAIEWKPKVCKHLYKTKGFKNPSSKFDKKYSIAAAKAIIGNQELSITDHEADAICLAFLPRLK